MNFEAWEEDLQKVSEDLFILEKTVAYRSNQPLGLVSIQFSINQKLRETFRVFVNSLLVLHKSTSEKDRRLFAVSYWVGELSKLSQNLCFKIDLINTYHIWITLFSKRLFGHRIKPSSMCARSAYIDLVSQKDYCRERLEATRDELKKVQREKTILDTEAENFLAAHCLQIPINLKSKGSDSHPLILKLNELLYGIFLFVHGDSVELMKYKTKLKEAESRSAQLLDQCRALMEASDRLRSVRYDPGLVRLIKDSMVNLQDLNREVASLADNITYGLHNQAVILLQKKIPQSKT